MSDNTNTKDIVLESNKRPDSLPSFLVKKNQRLTSALYMVTGYLSDQDPLKWRLRSVSLEIVSALNHLSQMSLKGQGTNSGVYGQADLGQTLSKVNEVLSLIEVATSAGSVSQMNLAILQNEYQKIKSLLEKSAGPEYWSDYLLSAETDSRAKEITSALSAPTQASGSKGQSFVKDNQKDEGLTYKKQTPSSKLDKLKTASVNKGQNSNARQETIKSFLTGKDWASIKDIANAVPDCSAKTVQRELADMVTSGLLKKKGDRRWARYSLNY